MSTRILARGAALAGCLAAAAGAVHAQVEPTLKQNVTVQRFYGYAYGRDSHKYLYTEVYAMRFDAKGHWLGGTIRYFWADGRPIGHKVIEFTEDPFVPVYSLDLTGENYREGITKVAPDGVRVFKKSHLNNIVRDKTIGREPLQAADSGFDALITAHLDALMAGQAVYFDLVVPGQLDDYHLTVKKFADTTFEGQGAVIVKVKPNSLLSLLADPLFLTYSPSGKLLEYKGISNILDPETGKVYSVDVVFPSTAPKDVPPNLPPLE